MVNETHSEPATAHFLLKKIVFNIQTAKDNFQAASGKGCGWEESKTMSFLDLFDAT